LWPGVQSIWLDAKLSCAVRLPVPPWPMMMILWLMTRTPMLSVSAFHPMRIKGPVLDRIFHVLRVRIPSQVFKSVVEAVAVAMASLHASWPWPDKRTQNQRMHIKILFPCAGFCLEANQCRRWLLAFNAVPISSMKP
jgi:hypothetical protein